MTAKEYLYQLIELNNAIIELDEKLDWFRSQAQYRSQTLSDMPKSQAPPKTLSDLVADMEPLSSERDAVWDMRIDLVRQVEAVLVQINDQRFRQVLRHRYVFCKEWEAVAQAVGYSEQYVFQLHGWALKEFSMLMKDLSE